MNNVVIPTSSSLTAEWLSNILAKAGHKNSDVSHFDTEIIGTGQMGKCIRIKLNYNASNHDGPATLVAKFPSDDANSRATSAGIGAYKKEVAFYRDFQPRLTIETPKCYFADIEENGDDFALILADLAPAEQGNQLEGCLPVLVHKAISQVVGLHAPSWNNDEMLQHRLAKVSQKRLDGDKALYNKAIGPFIEEFSPRLSKAQCDIFQQAADSTYPLFAPRVGNTSLVHTDFRLDNLMIDPTGAQAEISVVDWQTYSAGNPLADVAYFIASSLTVEERREHEESIVRGYHQQLQECGVKEYSWDQCWMDYRLGAFSGFLVAVIASVFVKKTDRGDKMFTLMADRLSQQAIDLNSQELFT